MLAIIPAASFSRFFPAAGDVFETSPSPLPMGVTGESVRRLFRESRLVRLPSMTRRSLRRASLDWISTRFKRAAILGTPLLACASIDAATKLVSVPAASPL